MVDVWNGIAIAPTDPVLHSTVTATRQTTGQIGIAKSQSLRKAKSPMFLLVVCCIGAMLYELGVWTEAPDKKPEEEKSTSKDGDKKMTESECTDNR